MVIVLESLSICSRELPSFWWLFFLLIYMGLPCTLFIVEKKLYNCQRTYFQFRREKKIKKPTQHCVNVLFIFFIFWPMFTWMKFFLNECASHWAQMLSAFHSKISVSTLGRKLKTKRLDFFLQKLFGWKKKSLKNRRLLYFFICMSVIFEWQKNT